MVATHPNTQTKIKKALAELMRTYNAYEAKVNVKQQQAQAAQQSRI
jgi:hypothetical protein